MKFLAVTIVWLGLSFAAQAQVTLNPADKHADITLSNGNLTAGSSNASLFRGVRSTPGITGTTKIYFETLHLTGNPNNGLQLALADSTASLATFAGADTHSAGYGSSGSTFYNNSFSSFEA